MEPQWVPSEQDIADARITDFTRFVVARTGADLPDYHALWRWSVDNLSDFWLAVWEYFDLGPVADEVLPCPEMPNTRWFPGTTLNYVDRVAGQARTDRPAILQVTEGSAEITETSWTDLLAGAAAFARTLRDLGVRPGDRVVGYLPNITETVVAFLGTAAIGAVWSACGQDYSAKAALDRLGQLQPVVLVTADGYRYGGKTHDKSADIADLREGLDSLRATVVVERLGIEIPGSTSWAAAADPAGAAIPATEAVNFAHPLWIVFSSGTTGLPKGIVHGHGGVILEHLKAVALQSDIGPADTFFWYTSPSWMMWNFQLAGLLAGATIVCYDGSPAHPRPDSLWEIAARTRTTVLGTSPGYVLGCMKAGSVPAAEHDLTALRLIGITGSSLPPASALWLHENAGGVPVSSISGGTDVVSAFAGGVRTVPVWPGELSAPYLGVALEAFDEVGQPVRGEVGELVVTAPMPSMPVQFWRDPDGNRYHDAYFDTYPGVWRHGDWITLTGRGSVVVHGRSDSTLNRHGIRMGSADIYQAVERLPEVAEALVIGAEQPDGGYWMPLFVVLAPGTELTDALRDRIKEVIRTEVSPRHVPDEILVAPAIPHTRTGKKLEVPIKRLFQGADPARVVERSAVDDPDLLDWFTGIRPPGAR
ncbi:acetoacetate--CoA ligase [Nocardia sp. NPDC001965]